MTKQPENPSEEKLYLLGECMCSISANGRGNFNLGFGAELCTMKATAKELICSLVHDSMSRSEGAIRELNPW
jgi:hypothetical protein